MVWTNFWIYLKNLSSHTNNWINLMPKFEQIFKYIQCHSKKSRMYALKRWHVGGNGTKLNFKYLLIYLDHKAILQIFSNIKGEKIRIWIIIWGTTYSYILIFECLCSSLVGMNNWIDNIIVIFVVNKLDVWTTIFQRHY